MFKLTGRPSDTTILYILSFIFTLHYTPAVYISSSYVNTFIGAQWTGYLFTIASIFALLTFFKARQHIEKNGNFNVFLAIILIEILSLIMLTTGKEIFVILGFILNFTATAVAFFNLDIFLENISDDSKTGSIRGVYLTSINTAFVAGPILSGIIVEKFSYEFVYLFGLILMLPVLYLTLKYEKDFDDPEYKHPSMLQTCKELVFKHTDLHNIFIVRFMLQSFFAIMVIYSPIYLHQHIGFGWHDIGLILSVGLIPFVLFEAFLGRLADTKFGEKEFLIAGTVIMGISTAVISFITSSDIFLWMFIIFMTRVGASTIEIMAETYLFKKIDGSNLNIISLYRGIRPVAYIIAPIIVSIILFFSDIQFVFIALAIFVLYNLFFIFKLHDTK